MPSLLDSIRERAAASRVPLAVHLDLTWHCNETCAHCYLPRPQTGEMNAREVDALLHQLARAGTLFLVLSGGEPLLRPDLFTILESARALSFAVGLKTNGTLITSDLAQRIAALSLQHVDITLYSASAHRHDQITGAAGSFARSTGAIRFLIAAGVKVRIVNVLLRATAGDYPAVRELARACGAAYSLDPAITPHLTGDTRVLDHRLSDEQLQQIASDSDVSGVIEELCLPRTLGAPFVDEALCSAAQTFCYISPCGDVFPCVQFPLACGNVRERPFLDIWLGPQMQSVRSLRVADLLECRDCPHFEWCSPCPGLAFLEGNVTGKSTLECQRTKAWASVLAQKKSATI